MQMVINTDLTVFTFTIDIVFENMSYFSEGKVNGCDKLDNCNRFRACFILILFN